MIKILIAEDQGMLLGALAALLNLEDDLEVIGQVANGRLALDHLQNEPPDILLTDIEMPEMTGLELANQIYQQKIPIKVIILTTFARAGYLRRAMDAGVVGYMLKESPSTELAEAIRKIHQGAKIVAPELLTEAWSEADPLNDRERQVLRLAGEGLSTKAIAQKIHLSEGTVRNYLSEGAGKLNAKNRVEAARIARQKGWL